MMQSKLIDTLERSQFSEHFAKKIQTTFLGHCVAHFGKPFWIFEAVPPKQSLLSDGEAACLRSVAYVDICYG